MKSTLPTICTALFIASCLLAGTNDLTPAPAAPNPGNDISHKKEVEHAIERGLRWMETQQQPGGFWSQPDHPALTALVLTGFMREPTGRVKANPPEFIRKGYAYLSGAAKPDGGLYVRDLTTYNTAIGVMALVSSSNPDYESAIRKARRFIIEQQNDFDTIGKPDNPVDGGIGYGDKSGHADLSATTFALEAIRLTDAYSPDTGESPGKTKSLNWAAATRFIERCQNLPGVNDQPWASNDPTNRGGFVYSPVESKAGEEKDAENRTALRSYGSMSYAGLLSYVHADLKRDDPRVKAVVEWLGRNYTLDENPGMGAQGLYYYYLTMSKALAAYGAQELPLANGRRANWRKDLALKLLDLQNGDCSWANTNGRWWEKDPVLVTAYVILTLEIVHQGL